MNSNRPLSGQGFRARARAVSVTSPTLPELVTTLIPGCTQSLLGGRAQWAQCELRG